MFSDFFFTVSNLYGTMSSFITLFRTQLMPGVRRTDQIKQSVKVGVFFVCFVECVFLNIEIEGVSGLIVYVFSLILVQRKNVHLQFKLKNLPAL